VATIWRVFSETTCTYSSTSCGFEVVLKHTTIINMPKGKRWSPEENLDLAQAWIEVSEDAGSPDVKGTNQDSDEFWARVHRNFKEKGGDQGSGKGVYGDRAITAIQNQWKDNISRNIKNFNKAIAKVNASNLSGVTNQQKVNVAVAIHLGKTDVASTRHRNFQVMDWKFYQCWLALKEHPAFLPPKQKEAEEIEDDDDEDEE
jgi:hypothetical protein